MTDSPVPHDTGDRLAKVIARSGLCSRRDAEAWITAGRVSVNGKKVLTPAFNVTSRDKVMVDGAPLAARQGTRVWLYHKPAGLVVTEKDPEGRPTVFEALEEHGLPRVVSVGRLDINTEGLLLVTNDGGLKRVLELPATGWLRRYRVRAHGTVTQAALDRLKDGIEIDGIKYGAIEATLEREQGSNVWIVMALREGKNREVKNVLGALGLEVNRLIRVSYGPFQLGDIPVGAIETVKAKTLRDQLGKKLADAADVDFDSEMPEISQLTGKPTRDRLTGRGTNTVEIAQQRFRFTDHAEKTEEEIRAERPRQDRPGRFDSRKPAARRVDPRADEEMAPPRRIHFEEDGRAPEDFVAKRGGGKPAWRDPDDQSARTFGKRPERPAKPAGDKKSFGDKKPRADKKSFGDKPAFGKPRREGEDRPKRGFSERPARAGGFAERSERPKRDFGDRPPRRDDAGAPQRGFAERPRGPRPEGGRPPQDRAFTGTPRGPRRNDAAAGERPPRSFAPRTRPDSERGEGAAFTGAPKRPGRNFSEKPRSMRPDADRAPRPARAPRPGRDNLGSEAKTYGKPKTRADGKPHPKRDGAAPSRGPRPGGPKSGAPRSGAPKSGARPTGPRRPKA
ncbi:pseudouridine synthase [Devosia yakushimensis]|uniref:Pseudouridine synthase n=1 Tax=Devosia yakushimensis TaxID=470028 RepID=A0ABQ5UFM5_9HYPH|nr:pseudouridine synthase [Devosia yakushimensis]GLQ10853.1 pseudouridine synthase [Devosia yakushimensis]